MLFIYNISLAVFPERVSGLTASGSAVVLALLSTLPGCDSPAIAKPPDSAQPEPASELPAIQIPAHGDVRDAGRGNLEPPLLRSREPGPR